MLDVIDIKRKKLNVIDIRRELPVIEEEDLNDDLTPFLVGVIAVAIPMLMQRYGLSVDIKKSAITKAATFRHSDIKPT